MRKLFRRYMALLLALSMASSLSVSVFADEWDDMIAQMMNSGAYNSTDSGSVAVEEFKDPNEGKVLDPETGEYVTPEELERRQRLREQKKAEEDAQRKAEEERLAEEQRKAEEAERQREEETRKLQEEAERQRQQEEADRKAREEAEKAEMERLEKERQEKEAAELLEQQKKAQQEKEEADRKAKEEAERIAKEQEEQRKKEEEAAAAAQKQAEEEARRVAEEAKKAEEERKAAEAAEKKRQEEEAASKPVAAGISVTSLPTMKVGDTVSLSANPTGGTGIAVLSWSSTNPSVATVDQSGVVKAVGKGSAEIAVTANFSDGRASSETCSVTVEAALTKLNVTGGSALEIKIGDKKSVTANVTGGSGNYMYDWDYSSEGNIFADETSSASTIVYGSSAGKGTLSLTVTDKEDPNNNATTTWSVTVTGEAKPISARLSNEKLTLAPGATKQLSVTAEGGSGSAANYDFSWRSTAPMVISISGSGSSINVIGVGAGTGTVEVIAIDKSTGVSTTPLYCTVEVTSSTASYSTSASATVGSSLTMNNIAGAIANEFKSKFGRTLDYGAAVTLGTASSAAGSMTLQDGTVISAGTNYVYASMQDMIFVPITAGTYTTNYTINDGGNVISGTISISVTGGNALSDVTLSSSYMNLDLYSSQSLRAIVTPATNDFRVTWYSNNTSVAYVDGTGASVIICSQGRSGNATITATVTDGSGRTFTRTCSVSVRQDSRRSSNTATYNPSLSVTMGSDYYGTSVYDSLMNRFRDVFGVRPDDSAIIRFSSVGDTSIARSFLRNGSAERANTDYTMAEYRQEYMEVYRTGSFSANYTMTYAGYSLTGSLTVKVTGTRLDVSMDQSNIYLSPYGSQYLDLRVYPRNEYYSVSWSSSNDNIARVSGSGASVKILNDGRTGTATITATVRDRNGDSITKRCSVTVSGNASSNNSRDFANYSPRIAMTLGRDYTGTETSDALAREFRNAFGLNLPDSATIRFDSIGDTRISITRLANGTPERANYNYTMSEYKGMYMEANGTGSFSAPYTLTYGGKTLKGSIIVDVTATDVSTSIELNGTNPYSFNSATAKGTSASSLITTAINNSVGTGWSYLVFGTSTSTNVGTLYLNSGRSSLTGTKVNANALSLLYFVPSRMGSYDIPYTVYNTNGSTMATGRLFISVGSTSTSTSASARSYSKGSTLFADVVKDAFYDTPVGYALDTKITNGTGKVNGKETFSPNKTCITAEIITFLYRSQGSPAVNISNPFTDVKQGDYFYTPALWAYQNGLVTGNKFNAMSECKRGDTVTYMWKLAGRPGATASTFSDVQRGTDLASAVDWALEKGITNGYGKDANGNPTFGPDVTCTRGQIVTFLHRAYG